ncbi:MAG: hypothetical protein V4801_30580 [Burkholderia gladioli]
MLPIAGASGARAYRFASARGFRLGTLRFPYPLAWHTERGTHRIAPPRAEAPVLTGGLTRLPAEQVFDIVVMPGRSGAAAGSIVLPAPAFVDGSGAEPDWAALHAQLTCTARHGFALALTQAMFELPAYAWQIERVAYELAVSRRTLQMALFRECYSFNAALLRCRRLNRLLHGAGEGGGGSSGGYGGYGSVFGPHA